MEILVVCTGNRCRSPFAEALLRDRLRHHASVHLSSVGLLPGGVPVDERTHAALRARGVEPPFNTSRQLTADLLRHADLVLGMARQHVREAVVLDRTVFSRTFTLRELVRRASRVGPRRADQSLQEWLDVVGHGRSGAELVGDIGDDDLADPIGARRRDYERVMAEIEELVDELVELAWPEGAGSGETPPQPQERASAEPSAASGQPRIGLAGDYGGDVLAVELLSSLLAEGRPVLDLTVVDRALDASAYGSAIGRAVSEGQVDLGVGLSATGHPLAWAANRVPGVRAAVVHDVTSARLARSRDAVNVVCFGAEVTTAEVAREALAAFLDAHPPS